MLHKNINLGDVHRLYNWEVQDTAALNALVVTSGDIGKVARQLDNNTYWILNQVSPTVEWGGFGSGSGSGGNTLESTGDIAFNALSPITLGNVQAGQRVLQVQVIIPEAWDGTGASLTVGTDTTNDLLVKTQDTDITSTGTYEIQPNYAFTANETIKVFIAPGTLATTGKVFISINLSN